MSNYRLRYLLLLLFSILLTLAWVDCWDDSLCIYLFAPNTVHYGQGSLAPSSSPVAPRKNNLVDNCRIFAACKNSKYKNGRKTNRYVSSDKANVLLSSAAGWWSPSLHASVITIIIMDRKQEEFATFAKHSYIKYSQKRWFSGWSETPSLFILLWRKLRDCPNN